MLKNILLLELSFIFLFLSLLSFPLQEKLNQLARDNEELRSEMQDLLNSSVLASTSRDQGGSHIQHQFKLNESWVLTWAVETHCSQGILQMGSANTETGAFYL